MFEQKKFQQNPCNTLAAAIMAIFQQCHDGMLKTDGLDYYSDCTYMRINKILRHYIHNKGSHEA